MSVIDWRNVETCLNGRTFKDSDGLRKKITVSGSYPYIRIDAETIKADRNKKAYRDVRKMLKDDWTSDLQSRDPEHPMSLGVIAQKLGCLR